MSFQVHPLVRPSVNVDVVTEAAAAAAAAVLAAPLEAAAAPVGLVRDPFCRQRWIKDILFVHTNLII